MNRPGNKTIFHYKHRLMVLIAVEMSPGDVLRKHCKE